MNLLKAAFFNETSCEHELTEHCPQVIEPGSPPRTNPNHPTVSSLVSRGPQSLVSHGCLTTPLFQCTLCLHLLYTSLSWTHHSPIGHVQSCHIIPLLTTDSSGQTVFATIKDDRRTPVIFSHEKPPCYHVAGCDSSVIYSLVLMRCSIFLTEHPNSFWAWVRVHEGNLDHYEVTPFSSVDTAPPRHTTCTIDIYFK